MKHQAKYAILNIGVLLLGLAFVAFACAGLEHSMGFLPAAACCGCLAGGINAAWHEICRMERAARQRRHVAAVEVQHARQSGLRVA